MIPPAWGSDTEDPWHSSPENSDSWLLCPKCLWRWFRLRISTAWSIVYSVACALASDPGHFAWIPDTLVVYSAPTPSHVPTLEIYLSLSQLWAELPHTLTFSTKASYPPLRARCRWEHRHVKPEDAILKIGWSGDRPVFPMKTVRALVATMSPGEEGQCEEWQPTPLHWTSTIIPASFRALHSQRASVLLDSSLHRCPLRSTR